MSPLLKKILIVDDDQSILDIIKFILEGKGYKVYTDDGRDIFEKIAAKTPDLILLDIRLSGLDGRNIGKTLKNKPETKTIPVIIISASYNIEAMVKQAQADDFLKKPFDIRDLESIVEKYLEV